jgi:hypothetical protein
MLKSIFILCRSIELAAETAYRRISNEAKVDAQKAFWLEISQDEKRHAIYWEQLIELEKNGSIQNPFDNPKRILSELSAMKSKIDEMIDSENLNSAFSDLILWAFRIEFYMLHPAFAILYHFLRTDTDDISPEEDYQNHIEKFAQVVKKHLKEKPELALVGETLSSMWERNRELASQFSQIKTLRGLIPICANCKQVRNDQGYWERIEDYVGRYSETKFSHGICPECKNKLYPGISQGSL